MSKEEYFESGLVKLIATRFARESRNKGDVTSNNTITHFEKWFDERKANFISVPFTETMERLTTLESELAGYKKALEEMRKCGGMSKDEIQGRIDMILNKSL